MKAVILNSGLGRRMGSLVAKQHKCMTILSQDETILSRQLNQLISFGITEIIITTGAFADELVTYCNRLALPINITFVHNAMYENTNYIYSIYCARKYLDDDIILLHGDLVFEDCVLNMLLASETSCMTVSSTALLSKKDFKAVMYDRKILKVGVEFFDNALAAQPLYKINKADLSAWMQQIILDCESRQTNCYAEDAFNKISGQCNIYGLDIKNLFCCEVDTPEDLLVVREKLATFEKKTVYMCFSTDMIHSGHIDIIRKAARLGRLIVGVLTDEAVISYKRYPILPFAERKVMFENIVGVSQVIEQNTLSYKANLKMLQPDYVVHGDNWTNGVQKTVRDEVIEILKSYGGQLIEYPYSKNEQYGKIERQAREILALPDYRRARLKNAMSMKKTITAIESHSGITGLIAEQTVVYQDGKANQFDAIWVSSLCDSTAKGKPDIELVDMTSRLRTIDDIMEVTTKPIIFDGDTGGLTEHFVYTVKTLERMGVSMIIIEDKKGLKKNSLFGTEVVQEQEDIEAFSMKIRAGKNAQKGKDFMICARIESLILEKGMEDALKRAHAFVEAGADAIMIHSRKKEPDEIFEFAEKFRASNKTTPLVVVPTSFNAVTEEEFKERDINIVIYANHLTRTGFPAMQNAAKMILQNHRAKECDEMCMSIKEIITLIPEELN